MKIGIIGMGIVGNTIYRVMSLFFEDVRGYDTDPQRSKNTLLEVFNCDAIFIALPTPIKENGRLDGSLVLDYLRQLSLFNYQGLVIVKSTLPIGFWKTGRKINLRSIYSPEFLHERRALLDFINPSYIVVSGAIEDYLEYMNILYWIEPAKFYKVGDRTAEIIKLAMNAFAATKISFVNEIERISEYHGADIEKVMQIIREDKRCANEYSYPKRGAYGGRCLTKDIKELKNSTVNTWLLDAVERTNDRKKRGRK